MTLTFRTVRHTLNDSRGASRSDTVSLPVGRDRWRRAGQDEWSDGYITFEHVHDPRPDYLRDGSRPKLSAARRQREEEDELHEVQDSLRNSSPFSLRDFFRDGSDGSKVPQTFKITADTHYQTLNNHSTKCVLDTSISQ